MSVSLCHCVTVWLPQNLPKGARVGADLCCLSVDSARRLQHELFPKQQQLVPVSPTQ